MKTLPPEKIVTDFASTPNEILFENFEVGKSYSKIFELTNVTSEMKTIRFREVSPPITDFFATEFIPKPALSPGMSTSFKESVT